MDAGHHGRKTGRGFYEYAGRNYRAADPECPAVGGGDGRRVMLVGSGPVADLVRYRAHASGFELVKPSEDPGEAAWLAIDAEPVVRPRHQIVPPTAVLCARGSLSASRPGAAAGFHVLPPSSEGGLVELTSTLGTDPRALGRSEEFFAALGFVTERVGDAPGLVLGRIVCQLVNEAAFAYGEDAGSAEDIDDGARLGLNYPRGPLTWGALIGLDHIRAVLEGLRDERQEERYRLAPALLAGTLLD